MRRSSAQLSYFAVQSVQFDKTIILQLYTSGFILRSVSIISLEEQSSLFICFSHANIQLRNPNPDSHAPCYIICCREERRENIGKSPALQATIKNSQDFPTMYSTHISSVIKQWIDRVQYDRRYWKSFPMEEKLNDIVQFWVEVHVQAMITHWLTIEGEERVKMALNRSWRHRLWRPWMIHVSCCMLTTKIGDLPAKHDRSNYNPCSEQT